MNFQESLVIVGTTYGSSFGIRAVLTNGDLKVTTAGTKDLQPGFRYLLERCPRDGIKTVNQKELR